MTQNPILSAIQEQTDAIKEQNRLLRSFLGGFHALQPSNRGDYLTTEEAGMLLSKTSRTIRRWVMEGKLKAVKLNRGVQQDRLLIHKKSITDKLRKSCLAPNGVEGRSMG